MNAIQQHHSKITAHDRAAQARGGVAALVIGHCAGLMDISALPVWVGMVLVGKLAFEPQRAGLLLSLFLGCVVLSSLFFAPRIARIPRKRLQPAAYALAGICFAVMSLVSASYAWLAGLHAIAGLAVGCGLSIVNGTMACTANPHRTAALAFTALSLVSTIFLSVQPALVEKIGPNVFFFTMAGVMFTAALAGMLAFPEPSKPEAQAGAAGGTSMGHDKLPRAVWFGIAGVSLLMVTHSMILGFVERIGVTHGFSAAQIGTVLVVSGLVNLVLVTLTGPLGRRLSARHVVVAGPLIQACAGLAIAQVAVYASYIVGTSLFISILTFTHVFCFGLLARMDPSGRVLAATPVMVMTGSALGPALGGILAQHIGYTSLGWAALAFGVLSASCFRLSTRATA
jgi:predicted MFS family arabinose efflux permease